MDIWKYGSIMGVWHRHLSSPILTSCQDEREGAQSFCLSYEIPKVEENTILYCRFHCFFSYLLSAHEVNHQVFFTGNFSLYWCFKKLICSYNLLISSEWFSADSSEEKSICLFWILLFASQWKSFSSFGQFSSGTSFKQQLEWGRTWWFLDLFYNGCSSWCSCGKYPHPTNIRCENKLWNICQI